MEETFLVVKKQKQKTVRLSQVGQYFGKELRL